MRKRNIWVSPHGDGYAVKREGNSQPSRVTTTQRDAIKIGKGYAKKDNSELIIQRKNGTIRSKDSYGKDPCPPKDKEH